MPEIEWKVIAQEDLANLINYIVEHNVDAAQKLKDEIQTKVANLANNPKLYQKGRVENTREMVIRSNYIVVYSEESDKILIQRVLHAAQQWPID